MKTSIEYLNIRIANLERVVDKGTDCDGSSEGSGKMREFSLDDSYDDPMFVMKRHKRIFKELE
jgi:hypothetical protein